MQRPRRRPLPGQRPQALLDALILRQHHLPQRPFPGLHPREPSRQDLPQVLQRARGQGGLRPVAREREALPAQQPLAGLQHLDARGQRRQRLRVDAVDGGDGEGGVAGAAF